MRRKNSEEDARVFHYNRTGSREEATRRKIDIAEFIKGPVSRELT